MDHAQLIAELPMIVEKMTPAERIQLARERRQLQLHNCIERDRVAPPPPPRRERLKFRPEIALLEATSRDDSYEVERLLMDGAFPNSHNEDGLTPLHQCAIDNNEAILLLLIKFKGDVNAQDTEQWTPLHAAACCAHKNIVRHLIDNGANLMAVNADGNMPYDICDDDDTLDLIESEMAKHGITQEHIDEQRGAPERVMLQDMKVLHQNKEPLDFREGDGSSSLHVAAAHGYYDVAAFLLRCDVSPNVRDNDLWQPMHAAACWAQADIIELLAEYGGDVYAKTNTGETPFDLCEDESTRAVIATLQAEAARRKRRNAFGARDSRRQSRKKKAFSKFESPQQPQSDSPFSARGAIRRLSLRDKSGLSLARLEARKEGNDLMRSWSLDDELAQNAQLGVDGKRKGDDGANTSTAAGSEVTVASNGRKLSPTKGSRRIGKHAAPSPDAKWIPVSADILDDRRRMGELGDEKSSLTANNGGEPIARYRAPFDSVVGAESDVDSPRGSCNNCCVIS